MSPVLSSSYEGTRTHVVEMTRNREEVEWSTITVNEIRSSKVLQNERRKSAKEQRVERTVELTSMEARVQ